MNLATIFDVLQPQTNAAAVDAANAALDSAAARPFSVVISVDDETKIWLTVLALVGLVAVVLKR